nr:metalloregulator ArsR/SmtB family transcription factor [uncultured Methanospirillum sp.]
MKSIDIPERVQGILDSVIGVDELCERLPSQAHISQMSSIHHALSDPIRLKILYLLAIQPLCVCVIKECVKIADSKLSYHLTVLKKGNLIEGDQQGTWIIYRITDLGEQMLTPEHE